MKQGERHRRLNVLAPEFLRRGEHRPRQQSPTVAGDLPATKVGDDRLPAECQKTNVSTRGNVNTVCHNAEPLAL